MIERQEVAEHDVDDRPHARHRGADAEAGEAGFRDRRVDDALRAELLDEAREHLERRAGLGDILADDEDARIAAHLLGQRLADGFAKGQFANRLLACYGRLDFLALALAQWGRE